MALTGSNNAEKIWNFLIAQIGNAYGVAGLMGNLYAESALIPTNLQNSYESALGYTDATYTAAVDNGSYTRFGTDAAGYGLAQWTYHTRKKALLSYAQSCGASIGDLEMQLNFLVKELKESYSGVLSTLKNATSVKAASDAVLTKYEQPADQSDSVKTKRASYGTTYYNSYASGTTSSGTTSAGTSSSASSGTLAAGTAVKLSGVALYANASTKTRSNTITGTYYIWSASTSSGRIRVTNTAANVGKAGQVTGWVDVADIGGTSSAGTSASYTVKSGDTLSKIAANYGTTVARIVAANKSKYANITANYIQAGWVLTIPG